VLGEGPGPTAYRTGAIAVSDLRTDDRKWPMMALLRARAFSHNLTLAEVAALITSRRLRFTDDAESELS